MPQQPAAAADLPKIRIGAHEFHRRKLANGLRAVAVRDTGEKVSVFMVIGAGKRQETPATTGLAHLTEHALFTGTPTTPLGKHDAKIRALKGESNAYTRDDFTAYYAHKIPPTRTVRTNPINRSRRPGLRTLRPTAAVMCSPPTRLLLRHHRHETP